MKSQEVDYNIIGHDMQVVEIELDPGETVIAEAGAMNWMDEGISFEARMGDGSAVNQSIVGKLFSAGKRLLTGESLFLTHFTNQGRGRKKIAFAAPYPGSIVVLDLAELPYNRFTCQKNAFLCAAYGTRIDIAFTRRFGTGLFGGEGFILQRLEGNGRAFLHAGGTIVKKELNNETIRVDTGCLVGFTEGIDYDIEMVKGLRTMLFGGEGLFLATLRGTGTVYLQSLPFSRLANRIIQSAPNLAGRQRDEGSLLGGLGNLLDGDNRF